MKKIIPIILILSACLLLLSCGKDGENSENSESRGNRKNKETEEIQTESPVETTVAAGPEYTVEDFREAGVDELFYTPILMYHRIYDMRNDETQYTGGNVDPDGYNRTAEAFENDLETFYEWGYRMIRLDDYMKGYIDVEFGYSPVILTFDDGEEQAVVEEFDAGGNPVFAKGCAMDVLEKMKKKYPDYNVTATFFLNSTLFGNDEETDKRLVKWMVDNGYDIGNHTLNHPHLPKCSAEEIEVQVGYMDKILEDIIPGRHVGIVALPFGEPTDIHSDSKFDKIFNGTYKGHQYTNHTTLICGWTYEESPFFTTLDPTYVKRIRAYDNGGIDFDIEYNFKQLNEGRRYISDGDPERIVIRKEDRQWLGQTYGKEVLEY
ncbi:MAG: polysaccharide deacetylase family protein [Lachnospiraceae bacterium]|jgi:peptidoglycan/xylan/chitin deacetylase (PgdA/CDA1 family)